MNGLHVLLYQSNIIGKCIKHLIYIVLGVFLFVSETDIGAHRVQDA